MKQIKRIILASIIGLLVMACNSDFLDRPALGGLPENVFLGTYDAGFKLLVACYTPIGNHWDYQTMKFDIGNQLTDDSAKGGSDAGDRSRITEVVKGDPMASNEMLTTLWKHRFGQAIAPCNVLLSTIEEDTPLVQTGGSYVSKEVKQRWIAEAQFLRAFYYFDVAMMFGNVPIIDKPLDAVDQKNIVKEDADKVLAFILSDLNSVIENNHLPSAIGLPRDDFSRITKEGAIAFRAKVYMWMNNLEAAKKDLKVVVESNAYDLIDDYEVLFNDVENGYRSKESIFISLRDYKPPYISGSVCPQMNIGRNETGGWGGECPTSDLVNAFEKGDPRLVHSILSSGDEFKKLDGKMEVHDYSGYDNYTKQHSRKQYLVWSRRYDTDLQRTDWSFFHLRYADILLLYAEALIETNENKALAVELINKVRRRAFVTSSTVDSYADKRLFNVKDADKVDETTFNSEYKVKQSDDLRAAVRHERRVELACEGNRLYDLLRWGTYVSTMQKFSKTSEAIYSQAGQNVTDKTWPYPIPQSEIDDVGGSLTQNDNY